jgi:glutathione S-transferase
MILLYEHPLSAYAQKVKIALAEKAIPFETKLPEAFGGAVSNEDLKRDNPRHEVPTLIDRDVRIFDPTVILEYLEDKFSGATAAAARSRRAGAASHARGRDGHPV